MRKMGGMAIWLLAALVLAGIAGVGAAAPSLSNSGGGSWQYYKEITISENSGSTLTAYQVLVQFSGSNFPTSARLDGADIRFTDASNNELSYWIESWDYSGRSAKIWVKVPSIPASAVATIRMYYGNPNAGSSSSGTNTFMLFDDFETNTAPQWTLANGTGGTEYDNGTYVYSLDGSGLGLAYAGSFEWTDYIAEADYKVISEIQDQNSGIVVRYSNSCGYGSCGYTYWLSPSPGYEKVGILAGRFTWLQDNVAATISQNTWYHLKVIVNGYNPVNIKTYLDGILKIDYLDSTYKFSSGRIALITWYHHTHFDNIRVRKYASSEPTLTLGAEQPIVPPTTVPPTTVPPTTVPPTTVPPTTVPPTTVPPTTVPPTTIPPMPVDTTPPSISISKQIVDFNKNGQLDEGEKLVITYGANDESGVKSIKVLLDGNLIELRNNEGIYSVTTDSLSMGDHSIVIEAIDSNGNKKSEEMKINVARAGPSVYFPKSRYEVNEGDDFDVVLSAVNPIGNPKMDALLILKPPGNGISIYESDCKGFSGECTGKFEIEPGDSVRSVSTRMRADRAGEYQVDAEVYYQFENGQRSPTRYETLTVDVKPKSQVTNPANTQPLSTPKAPGFEIQLGVLGVIVSAFYTRWLMKKRN